MNPAFWYKMDVILDGSPAPFTKLYTRLHEKRDPNAPVIFDSFLGTLKPGQSQNFSVTVSDYFDFSTPGHYEITFSRGTDPGQPDNAVVQSNTITITVIPANTPAPESTNPSPFPNASETTPSSIVGPSPTTVSHGTSNPSTPTTTPAVSIVAVVKPEPAFTLNIEADPATARTYPALHRVLVTLTNVSSSILVNQFHTESLNMYNMVVLRNGIPAPETDAMKALAQYRKVDRFPAIRHPFVLYPGQTYTTSLDVSDYYDMSQPGTYQITITRQSLPLNPAYSTLVRSNSITTTVPPQTAASQSAETMPKPQPRFDLNISPEDPYAPVPPVMVRVEMENTSNSVIRIAKCWTFMGMYDLQVTRDGQPVPPTEEMLQLQKARAAVTCPRNDTLIEIKPGDSYAEDIPIGNFYDVSKPGVYQVYVTRQTYPWDPQKSILVQSNPISFQVPVSSASAASDSH
ncbi:MAG TPA: hypothetical protein VMD58_10315 [Acidobacteriaceae bacterium]|nr:hypothetical protein [Acidobacteriaceae bacterium]